MQNARLKEGAIGNGKLVIWMIYSVQRRSWCFIFFRDGFFQATARNKELLGIHFTSSSREMRFSYCV
jgi:hypothetical protein